VNAKIFSDFFSIRSVIDSFTRIFDFLYIAAISTLVYRSLTIRRQDNKSKKSFNTISTLFGIMGVFSIVIVFVNFYQAMFNNSS
jgi:nitrogen fixation/metabolism regulation signal transduction histidine kinase